MEKRLEILAKGCESPCLTYSTVNNKKIIKHALRQQVKRRRKNTTIAAGNSRSMPQLLSKASLSQQLQQQNDTSVPVSSPVGLEEPAVTMKDVLASLPGFSSRYNRKRSTKRLSLAAQLKAGLIDLESPASILTSTSLRMLLNRHTFQGLPSLYQRKLAQLLPLVDRQDAAISGLNNEFFARACLEWRKRLAEGEFTPENQQRIKTEAEKDKNKLDPWKLKHFEPIWGEKKEHKLKLNSTQSGDSDGVCCRFFNLQTPMHPEMDPLSPERQQEPIIDEKGSLMVAKDIGSDLMNVDMQVDMDEDEDEEDEEEEDDEDDNVEEEEDDDNISIQGDDDYNEEEDEEDVDEVDYYNEVEDDEDEDEEESEESQNSEKYVRDKYPEIVNVVVNSIEEDDKQAPTSEDPLLQQNSEDDLTSSSKLDDKSNQLFDDKTSSILNDDEQKDIFEGTPQIEDQQDQCNNEEISNTVEELGDVIEIDSETLQRIHELEVRGEMQEAYEEISNSTEEVIYPILDEMEINANNTEVSETILVGESFNLESHRSLNTSPEEEAFQDAHNYVCSEMLDGTWISNTSKTSDVPSKENVEHWPNTEQVSPNIANVESGGKPGDQIKLMSEEELLSAVNSNCLTDVKNNQSMLVLEKSASPTVIAFPQLQSIRFIQTNFQATTSNNLKPDQTFFNQNAEINHHQVDQNMMNVENPNVFGYRDVFGNKLVNNHLDNADGKMNKTPIIKPQQVNNQVNNQSAAVAPRTKRQSNSNSNKSRNNSTKTPPGTVNLERSYQICQAVIANSPNREQLKAQLRLPPGLAGISKDSGKGSACKKSANKGTSLGKSQKTQNNGTPDLVKTKVCALKKTNCEMINQCVFLKKTEIGETPRALSAPPLPPELSDANVRSQSFKGRPASVGGGQQRYVTTAAAKIQLNNNKNGETGQQQLDSENLFPNPENNIIIQSECGSQEPMIICRKCGVYCHTDCAGSQRLCTSCILR